MSEGLKTALVAGVVALVVVLVTGSVGAGEQSLGGTKVFKGDVTFTDEIEVEGSAQFGNTSDVTCLQLFGSGGASYITIDATGSFATSSSAC